MVLKKVVLTRDGALMQHNGFTQKMVLKKPFISDTWEDSAVYIHCSVHPGDVASR